MDPRLREDDFWNRPILRSYYIRMNRNAFKILPAITVLQFQFFFTGATDGHQPGINGRMPVISGEFPAADKSIGIDEQTGKTVSLDAVFKDELGRSVTLRNGACRYERGTADSARKGIQ